MNQNNYNGQYGYSQQGANNNTYNGYGQQNVYNGGGYMSVENYYQTPPIAMSNAADIQAEMDYFSTALDIKANVDSAFSKGMKAMFFWLIPYAGVILSIIFGSMAISKAGKAKRIAQSMGLDAGGRCTTAKVLGILGILIPVGICLLFVAYLVFMTVLSSASGSLYYY